MSDLASLPLVLVLSDMVKVYRRGYSTIRRECAAGTFRPVPFDSQPYRWTREAVEQDLARRARQKVGAAPKRRRRRRASAASASA